jgi:hypothetical protein
MKGRAASVWRLGGAIGDCNLQTGALRGAEDAAVATIMGVCDRMCEWVA